MTTVMIVLNGMDQSATIAVVSAIMENTTKYGKVVVASYGRSCLLCCIIIIIME